MNVSMGSSLRRLRPRQWVGAAIDVAGMVVIVRQLAGWAVA